MKAPLPTSASPVCYWKVRNAFLTTHWWRWCSRCRKKSLVKKTAPCFARDALLGPKMGEKKPRKRSQTRLDSRLASSITNSCTRVNRFQQLTEWLPAIFFCEVTAIYASKLFKLTPHHQELIL